MKKAAYNRIDFTGERVGDWEILGLAEVVRKSKTGRCVRWNAICHKCGETKTVSTDSLRAGSKNCFDCRPLGYEDPQEATYKKLYRKVQRKNKSIGAVSPISYEYFKQLTTGACHYSGHTPSNLYGSKNKEMNADRNAASFIIYNGIDRVDNTKGYEYGNVVACCATCNRFKRDMTVEGFINHCRSIVAHTDERGMK